MRPDSKHSLFSFLLTIIVFFIILQTGNEIKAESTADVVDQEATRKTQPLLLNIKRISGKGILAVKHYAFFRKPPSEKEFLK